MKQRPLARPRRSRLPLLVLLLCLIQPVMDVFSYWISVAGVNKIITLLLRLCILAAVVVLAFCLSRRKWVYFTAVGALLLLTAGHCAVCLYYGYQDPLSDLTNLVRIYHLPLMTLSFITFIKRDEDCLQAVKWGFLGSFSLMAVVKVLAFLTGTDPHTYANKGIGLLGWFLTPSDQSAILSMVVPVAVLCIAEWKKFHPVWTLAVGVLGFGSLYLFATRLSYAALLGCAFCMAASCLVVRVTRNERTGRAALVFAGLGIAALLLVGVSPMAENNARVAENARLKQEDILTLVAEDRERALADGLTGKELELASLKSAYEKYLPGVTGRFGLERTAEYYGYSTDVSDLSDARQQKLTFNRMLLQDQPLARLFGVELHDLTWDGVTYDAENDVHGIAFLCGISGLAVMLAFVLFFLIRVAYVLIRDLKGSFTMTAAAFGIAAVCGLAHAYFTAGVLRRPNSNYYLGVLLAVVYVLSTVKDKNRKTEENEE